MKQIFSILVLALVMGQPTKAYAYANNNPFATGHYLAPTGEYLHWVIWVGQTSHNATAEEIGDIVYYISRGGVKPNATYRLSSGTEYQIPKPDLLLDYYLRIYQKIDDTVTRANLWMVIKKDDVGKWDNNLHYRVKNYYYSILHSEVRFIPDYSGAELGVEVLIHKGIPTIKVDCLNPLEVENYKPIKPSAPVTDLPSVPLPPPTPGVTVKSDTMVRDGNTYITNNVTTTATAKIDSSNNNKVEQKIEQTPEKVVVKSETKEEVFDGGGTKTTYYKPTEEVACNNCSSRRYSRSRPVYSEQRSQTSVHISASINGGRKKRYRNPEPVYYAPHASGPRGRDVIGNNNNNANGNNGRDIKHTTGPRGRG